MSKQLTISDITALQILFYVRTPERAANTIFAAIDAGASKKAIRKLVTAAKATGMDLGDALRAELKRRTARFEMFTSKRPITVSARPFRVPFQTSSPQ